MIFFTMNLKCKLGVKKEHAEMELAADTASGVYEEGSSLEDNEAEAELQE
jgi:hypothetical protein